MRHKFSALSEYVSWCTQRALASVDRRVMNRPCKYLLQVEPVLMSPKKLAQNTS